jgi:phage terminase large subunit-like protein
MTDQRRFEGGYQPVVRPGESSEPKGPAPQAGTGVVACGNLIVRLGKASNAVYLAAEESVAAQLSALLREAIAALAAERTAREQAEQERDEMKRVLRDAAQRIHLESVRLANGAFTPDDLRAALAPQDTQP